MNISANLRRLRQKLDMTQEALAATIGVSPQAVSKWERGEGLPDITLVPSIAFALGVTTDVLFGVNEALRKEQVQKIVKEAARILFADMADVSDDAGYKPEAAAEYLREKLRDYPNEWELWQRLAIHIKIHSFRCAQGANSNENGAGAPRVWYNRLEGEATTKHGKVSCRLSSGTQASILNSVRIAIQAQMSGAFSPHANHCSCNC